MEDRRDNFICMGIYSLYAMVAQQYEIKTENCTHKNTHQYAGFSTYQDSHYKCEDCGAVSIVSCSPQEDTLEFGEVY